VVIADSEEEREVVIPDSDEEWEVRATAEEVEEQVEKDKGKGRATAEDVARGEEEEEPGVKPPRRVEEEEVGDDLAFDPEGEALDEDEEDREVEEDEEVEEGADLLARLHSLARPVEKIAGSRRRESIKLSCSVDSFKAVNIGRAGPLPPKSNEVQLQCILEFVNRMKFVIHQRYQLAHSLSRIDENSPFTYAVWIWWTCQTEEEIWTLVHDAVDRSRQIVLGGIFLGYYKFTNIPAPSDEELKLWCVYGDLVNDAEMYVGSATGGTRNKGGFARLGNYERAKRRSNSGKDVSRETRHSRHLRVGLQSGAVMELRILAFFDPRKCQIALPLAIEGMFIDCLQSFARDSVYQPDAPYMSPHCKQSSIDASLRQDARWTGLNGAHPFKQGIRRNSLARRLLEEQDWTCEVCCKQVFEVKRFYRSESFPLLQCKNPYVCDNCVRAASAASSDWDLETFLKVRRGDRGNSRALRDHGMLTNGFDALLEAQETKCPCCDKKGLTRQECEKNGDKFSDHWKHVRPEWSPHLNDAYWICRSCESSLRSYESHLTKRTVEEIILQLRDRKTVAAALQASLPKGRNAALTVATAGRYQDTRQTKLDAARAQNGLCAICEKLKWPASLTLDEMKSDGPTGYRTLSEKQQETFACPALVCSSCYTWARLKGKMFEAWDSTLGGLIEKRRL
jgi:hypothetical protein